jgi:hypothetical protein
MVCGIHTDAIVDDLCPSCLRAELTRLREIVGKLPKTADEVAVSDGDYVWTILDGEVIRLRMESKTLASTGWIKKCQSTLKASVHFQPSACYSIREAAEAARKAGA